MSSHEDTASSEAQPHACPRLCTPLEGLRAWDRLGGFSYAFLDDTTRRELARLDARALAHRVALARDGLLELLREQDIRASPWTEDVVRHASDSSDASESAPCESPATTRREKPVRGQAVVVLAFPPGLDFLVAFLACEACAAVAVPVRPPDPTGAAERFAEERRALIGVATASGARLALTTRAYAAAFAIADAKRSLFSTLRAKKVAADASSVSALPFAFVPLERVLRRRKRRSTDARVAPTPRVGDESNKNAKESVVAFVQFTSGSTGAPKGVVVGAEHVTTNCALIRARLGVTAEDSNVSWLPQFHDMGLVGAWLVPLTIPGGGGDRDALRHLFAARTNGLASERDEGVVVAKKKKAVGVFYSPAAFAKDPASWMRVASEYRATMTQGPDFAYRLCAMRFGKQSERNLKGFRTNEELLLNLSKLRSCLNASERAQHDTHFLFASTFSSHGWNPKSMRAGYGLAESVVYVCDGPVRVAQINRRALEETNEAVECAPFNVRAKELDDDDEDASSFSSVRVSSCGAVRVVSGDGEAQISALDPDVRVVCPETHKELPDGRVGEIWVRGGSVAFGYVDKDGFSLGAAFGVPLATGKIREKNGGYLRTGDVGFIDGVSGEVFVVGRMRDRFKVNGRAYSPEDIERVILDAKPGVFRRGGVAAFAFEEDALREKKKKKTIAFCTPATRVGVVAEVRDECLVHDPVAYARLLDDVREVVSVTHGVRLRKRDVALVRKGAAPKTSSGKKRRDETRKLFLDGYFFKKGVAVEGFSTTLSAENDDLFAEEHRFGSMFLLDDTRLFSPSLDETSFGDETRREDEKTSREESLICAKTFLRRLAKKRGARFAALHVETCLTRFFATEKFFLNPGSSMDSFAAVRLTARLEFELGVKIPPTLVLLNAAKPEKLARELLRFAVCDEDTEEDQHRDAAPDAASDTFFSVSPEERVRLSVSLDGTDGTETATKNTGFGDKTIVRAITLILLTLALFATRRESDGHSRVAFSLNRADEKEMAAHARFFEWRVRVAPAQIAIGVVVWVLTRTVRRFFFLVCGTRDDADENDKQRDVDARLLAFFSASANAFLTHGALGLCFVYAHVGVRFLCEKTLAKVLNTQEKTSSSPSRKTRVAIAWGLCLAELFLLNASEAWTARDSFTKWQKRKRYDGKEASLLSLFLKRGALAGSTFTPTRAARYVAIRSLDRSLDRIEKGLDTHSDAFVDAFAFAAQTATFQCGPLVPHATYAEKSRKSVSKKRKRRKKKKRGVSFGFIFLRRLTRLLSSLVPLASWCLLVDLMYAVGYRPTETFFARDVTVNAKADAREKSACGFSSFAQTFFFATASWITSHAVFGVPRAVAIAFDDTVGLGDDAFLYRKGDRSDDDDDDDARTMRRPAHVVPHDTPCFWPSAAKTPATFWRCFHASFFTFYFARCFAPLNGGYGGIVVSVAVSTAFHGFQLKWLMWGAITAFGLVAEKYVNGRFRVCERRREEKKTSSPRFASQTIETIRAAVVQTATVATFVGPATFPGLGLRTAAKVLTWGILISAAWQNAERVQRVAREARA